jgi:hypothetical protein
MRPKPHPQEVLHSPLWEGLRQRVRITASGRTRCAAAALGATVVVGVAGLGVLPAASAVPSALPSAARRAAQQGVSRRTLAAEYLAIAKAGNRRLESDFDPLEGRDRDNVIRADADLRDAAATERLFDRRLAQIAFPPKVGTVARRLYRMNQSRARLTAIAAHCSTLQELRVFERRLNQANAPVEDAVARIRRQLGLPPASTS